MPSRKLVSTKRHAIGHVVTRGVAARDLKRVSGHVGGDHARAGDFEGERNGDASAAGADVDDHGARILSATRQRFLDDELGFGPRDEHVRSDLERQAPELTGADDVGHRLAADRGAPRAARSAAGTSLEAAVVAIGQEAGAVPAERPARARTSASSEARLALMPALIKRSRAPCTRSWIVIS